jgi:hypothetical protein
MLFVPEAMQKTDDRHILCVYIAQKNQKFGNSIQLAPLVGGAKSNVRRCRRDLHR